MQLQQTQPNRASSGLENTGITNCLKHLWDLVLTIQIFHIQAEANSYQVSPLTNIQQ